jgi:hypothetical protein
MDERMRMVGAQEKWGEEGSKDGMGIGLCWRMVCLGQEAETISPRQEYPASRSIEIVKTLGSAFC